MALKTSLLLLLGLLAARPAMADGVIDKRFQLTVTPQFGAFRGQSPLPLAVTLSWSGSELVEGRLRLRWYVEQTHLGTYTTPETALSDSSFTRTFLLPPVIMPRDDAACSVQAEFVTKDRLYDLDIHDLAVPLDWRRTLIVGLCRTPPLQMEAGTVETQKRLIPSLRLEHFIDQPLRSRELSTMVLEVDPDNLPENPLQLLGFDMLVVPAESFRKLSDRSLQAMATWLKAGGSLSVLVDSHPPEKHVRFLNRLISDNPANAPYLRSDAGELLPVEGAVNGIDLHRIELGRLVVSRGPVEYDGDDWQRAMLFLWKVRQDRLQDWLEGTPWRLKPATTPDGYALPLTLQPYRTWSVEWMRDLLMPESIQGLPLLTVAAILILFLLAIAPGDYLLLGWLRRRRWTWVLFPAVSLLFTWVTMRLAEYHLGTSNLGRSITIVDLGSDGQPVRTSRIDLLYSASNQTHVAEVQDALMVPVEPKTMNTGASLDVTPSSPQYEQPWEFVGNLPGSYFVQREVRQWSPRLSRTTTLGPSEQTAALPLADLDWASIDAAQFEQQGGFESFRRTILMHEESADVIVLGDTLESQRFNQRPQQSKVFDFLKSISYMGDSALFHLVSQLSPTAAGQWEDLAILDPTDYRLSVLLVITESGEGQYVCYRKVLWAADEAGRGN